MTEKGPVVLGIDTATPQVSVALGGPDGPMASIHVAGGRRHGELLAPAIAEVCRLAQTPLPTVDAVVVDVGPGLFTGLRVGVATARALVSALGMVGVGVTSLEVLAAAHRQAGRSVVAVIDARRSEVFWAHFRGGVQVGPAAVATPEELARALNALDEEVLVVGDGAMRYQEMMGNGPGGELGGPDDAHPSAAVAVSLAVAGWDPTARDSLEPLYLRAPDVRIGWVKRDPVTVPATDG